MTRGLSLTILCASLLLAPACTRHDVPYPAQQSTTTDALRRLSLEGRQGDRVSLRSLTTMDWDRVLCFAQGTRRSDVNAAAGVDVAGSDQGRLPQPGPLLVFMREAEVTEAVNVLPPISLDCRSTELTAESATVRVRTKPPAPHGLTLEEGEG